jgi:hypothetical protein
MDGEIKPKFDEQTEDLYAAIGQFAVEFEHVCNYLRVIIMTILNKEGLDNEKVMQILLSDLTAEPLRSLVASLIPETQQLSETDRKVVSKILNSVQDLTKNRNDVLHGTWFIGWASVGDTEFKTAPGVKFKKDKGGVATKTFNWKVEDFDELTEEATKLVRLLGRLNGCIAFNFKLEKNFVFGSDGSLSGAPRIYE